MSADPRLDALLDAYLSGELAGDDVRELETRLDRAPEARARFAYLCRQDLALHDVLAAPASSVLAGRRIRSRRPGGRSWNPASAAPRAAVAALVAASLTGLLVYAATRRPQAPSRPVAVQTPAPSPEPSAPTRPPSTKEPGSFVRPAEPAPAPPPPPPTKEAGSSVTAPAPEPPPAAPTPPPPPPPTPAPVPTVAGAAAVARLEALEGEIEVVRDGRPRPAREVDAFLPGDGLASRRGTAALVFPDGTRVEVKPDTLLHEVDETPQGKRVRLSRGRIEAVVPRQPAGRPLAVLTAAAEARVLGTTLAVSVTETSTRLEVTEGRVRLTRLSDARAVEVTAGHFAVAGPGSDLLLRPLRRVDVVRVSFGPADAPLPDGFLGDAGAAFDPKAGLGWTGGPPTARLRPGPRPLLERRLVVAGTAREAARWDLAVQNGRYYVTLSCGDVQVPQGPHHVAVEGRLVIRETMTAAGEFLLQEDIPVDVRDGRLTIHVGGHGSAKVDPDGTADTALNYVIVRRAE